LNHILNYTLNSLIEKYKNKITELQKERIFYEKKSNGGMCISITSEIQAYNAVLSDLSTLINLKL
jgi:flagellar biosynthesis chaperone FliJ